MTKAGTRATSEGKLMEKYDFSAMEKKWRARWERDPVQKNAEGRPKYYCLDMFPYPSGTGLHVGHWRGYVLSDVIARHKILQGFHVLHPMGFDAFGLTSENSAIQQKKHPAALVAENIRTFKRQLGEMGSLYDWECEVNTTDPAYYKWTQWIFARMFEKGLAYEKEMPLNWCAACKVVLANEEAAGGVCDRCGGEASKKSLRQWMLRITAYADRLLDGLDGLDWPEKVKKMQADWIGRSEGLEIDFAVQGRGETVRAYTTRPDTLYGATFMTVAPEHPLAEALPTDDRRAEAEAYIRAAGAKSNVARMAEKEKTGVFTGRCALNPLSGERMPIWIADYVLADYGTGAIMCVPGHDERDFEFAKKHGLKIVRVISKGGDEEGEPGAYAGPGTLVNSGPHSGMASDDAKRAISDELEAGGRGKRTVNYKLRDWVFSRQRYWGEPIPIIHCADCGPVAVPDAELPVTLPALESYQPTDTGESPLALVEEWVNAPCPKCGRPAKRETNTMPQWAGSSWYFLRYPDSANAAEFASREALEKWLPVDYYVGGVEHAVLHLLYARFYTKFLRDIGAVGFDEPFTKLFNQGMVNYRGKKMSKSEGHGVSPDELLPKYGCDALRLYELFIGPPELDSEWSDSGIDGAYRFLAKVWRLAQAPLVEETGEMERLRHRLARDTTARLESLSMNTAVSGFMEHTNTMQGILKREGGLGRQLLETLAVLLAPFAPHIAEETWERLGGAGSVFAQRWPEADESKLEGGLVEIALQIGGKLRGSMQIPPGASNDEALALAREALRDRLAGMDIVREIYVPGKIANFVTKPAKPAK